jgi:hypothetical protein
MKDDPPIHDQGRANERPHASTAPQPWHAADEKPARRARILGGGPIGTHSLTGGGASVGLPEAPRAESLAERSSPRDEPPGAEEPNPLLEPRAGTGDLLGRK